MIYCFILGKNPQLSIAEISAVLTSLGDFSVVTANSEAFFVELNFEIDSEKLIKKLGGTIKIARVVKELKPDFSPQEIVNLFEIGDSKIFFGFSFYNPGDDGLGFKKFSKQNRNLGLKVKKIFKQDYNVSSRWVSSKESVLSSVIVAKNKLLTRGKELNIFYKQDKVIVAETLAVQDFARYSKLDYGRPGRDDESGMLPPKLAKIMLNLAKSQKDDVILDPFCGSGTVITQAGILGYKKVVGSDISDKAIEDTRTNLAWFKEQGLLAEFSPEIFQADVTQISDKLESNSVDKIVAEPYLGPAKFSNDQVDSIIKELSLLYIKAFEEFSKILKSGGRVVLVFPAWRVSGKVKYLDILDKIEEMGFRQVKFDTDIKNESRSGLLYGRDSQRIVREIWVFEITN